MRDRPSLTAAAVSFGRGVGLRNRRDVLASDVLPAPFAQALSLIRRAPFSSSIAPELARVATLGLVDHASLRMAAVDDALEVALASRPEQLVVLGAGLDTRAWRMEALAPTAVFELDHPATQAYKRRRVAGMRPLARSVRFVPVDFERESFGEVLEREGHRRDQPTIWLWEAVTMYLARAAVEATLSEIAVRSAPQSALILTYATPDLQSGRGVMLLAHALFRALGEPLIGAMARDEAHGLLTRFGFEPSADTGSPDWAARFGGSATLARPFASERLVAARRAVSTR